MKGRKGKEREVKGRDMSRVEEEVKRTYLKMKEEGTKRIILLIASVITTL